MSNDKCFGIDMESLFTPVIRGSGNLSIETSSLVKFNKKELRETYQKFNDEMAKAQTLEDKKKVLDTVFPNHSKNAKDLANKNKEIEGLAAESAKAWRNLHDSEEILRVNGEINHNSEYLGKKFPGLAADIQKYAEATIRSALTGEKNDIPKPAKKLPFWKKAIKPMAKLFGGKYNALDNMTREIEYFGKRISENPVSKGLPINRSSSLNLISSVLHDKKNTFKFEKDIADGKLHRSVSSSKDLFFEDYLYQTAGKEFDEKAPAIIKKNKVRGVLAQRGLIPETKSAKDVSGVVKVDQNIMAQQAAKKYSR